MKLIKNIYKYVLLCLCICYIQESFAKNSIYFYVPMEAELDGTIAKKKIDCNCGIEKNDDEGRTGGVVGYDADKDNSKFRNLQNECVFLLLDEPINIRKSDYHVAMQVNPKKNSESENNVEVLQMSNDDNIYSDFSIGDRVHVRGFLYRHFQNCDHSRVLIDVVDVKIIEREHKYSYHRLENFLKVVISKLGFYLKPLKS